MPTFNTTDPKPGYVYDSSNDTWYPLVGIAPASQVDRWTKTAAGGETSLSGNDDNAVSLSYTSGTEQVYLNGVLLVRGQDYTATNGTTITGLTALAASDVAEVVTFNPSNILTTDSILDTDFAAKGDLISASAASTPIRVPVGTNGQVLKANSATTSGLEWGTVDADIEGVTAGTGISGGGTSGTVTITNSMATAIDAKGDLIAGTAADTFSRLAVGTNGQVLTAASSAATGLEWGTVNGLINWTQRATSNVDINGGYYQIAYNGSNLYVAVGNAGKLTTSPDGITWTARTSGFGANEIFSVAYGNGVWVIVGPSGLISSSTDGITWTSRTSNMSTNDIIHVAYLNGNFVAVGAGANGGTGGITTSTNGTTWTKRTTPGSSGSTCYYVTYGNGYYVVATSSGTSKNLLFSTDLATWTASAVSSSTSGTAMWIYYSASESRWYANLAGLMHTSTTTTPAASWTWADAGRAFWGGSLDARNTSVHNGYMWSYSPATNGSCILGASLAMAGNYLKERKIINNVPSVPGASGDGSALLYESDSRIFWADGVGRIYTSF